MNVVRSARELNPAGARVCLAIGTFDGVHLGHQQIIRQTVADAEQHEAIAVVVTFDRHPRAVVTPTRTPPLIYGLPQKLRAVAALGADATLLLHFDEEFSRQTGEEFVRSLVRDFTQLQCVCVGSNFAFGHRRSGNVELLRQMGRDLHFQVHGLAAVALDGRPVSSTRIRQAIGEGRFDSASQMLGRGYALAGKVVRGDELGRQLGFPTANLDVAGLVLPPVGVYAVHAHVRGRAHRAVLNIGWRPTLANPQPQLRVETHLVDFDGDLYGQELELTFVARIRDERKFDSLEALKAQIAADISAARRHFV